MKRRNEKTTKECQRKPQASVGSGGPREEDGLVHVENKGDGSKRGEPPSKRAVPAESDVDQAKEEFRAALDTYTGSYEELKQRLVDMRHD